MMTGSERPTVALIAHDGKKQELIEFASRHLEYLARFDLIGTATTAGQVSEATGLCVEQLLSGPYGGDVQIAARIVTGDVAGVVFLVDPLNAHPHEPDIQAVQRVCNVHNVPLATNTATASLLISSDSL